MTQHNMTKKFPIKICRNEYVYNMSHCQLRISKHIRPLFEINKKHAFPRLPSYFTIPKQKLYPLRFGPLFRIGTPLNNFKTALYIATVLINKVRRCIVKVQLRP
jgi:hypothetical protein